MRTFWCAVDQKSSACLAVDVTRKTARPMLVRRAHVYFSTTTRRCRRSVALLIVLSWRMYRVSQNKIHEHEIHDI